MSDMLLQIYTRHERADVTRKYVFLDVDDGEKAHEDREWLLTEVERQRAEIERLRADLATQQGCCDGAAAQDAHIRQEREEHRAEVEKLRAENERLRAALKPFAALSLWPDDIGDEWTVNDIRSGYDWDETENDTKTDDVFIKRGHIRAARNALEGKP